MSESATDVMNRTRGSLKLGGNPKDILPSALIKVMAEEGATLPLQLAGGNGAILTTAPQKPGLTDLKPIMHHQIKSLFPEE